MNPHLSRIHTHMLMYGAVFGLIGGAVLGMGFASLTYNPFFNMNILIVLVGGLATAMVGACFGAITGGLCGVTMSLLTALCFRQTRFFALYKISMASLTLLITGILFLNLAHLVGRPFIELPAYNQSWYWSLLVALIFAGIASVQTANHYLTARIQKVKNQ